MKLKKSDTLDIDEYNIRINNLNGIFQVTASNLVLPFAAMFAKRLNATDYQVAMLNSLPAIISVGAIIPGAIYIQKHVDKKAITGKFFIMARCFYLLFSLVPLISKNYQASLFVLLYGLMNLPGSIALAAWQSFISCLFPSHMMAGVLAKRNRISTFLGTAVTLVSGFILYNIPRTEEQRIFVYQIFFMVAFLLSTVEVFLFFKYKVPDSNDQSPLNGVNTPVKQTSLKDIILSIRSNKIFLSYCSVALLFHFAWYMPQPLFPLYEIDILHSNEAWTSIITVVNATCSAFTYSYWVKFIAKKGNGPALALSALMMGFVPLAYPHLHAIYMVLPVTMVSGVGISGLNISLLNTIYEVSPEDSRTLYIAVFNTMTNTLLIFAPLIGIWLKGSISISASFSISGILRVLAGLLFYLKLKTLRK